MDYNFTKLLKCINKLRDTDKNKINEISILSGGFKEDEKVCQRICDKIMDNIKIADNNTKLCLFYSMDSIVKNICQPFNKFFAESLVETFVDTFKSCKDSSTRVKLHKLRDTWKENHFPYEITNEIDRKIRVIDPHWPVVPRKVKSEPDQNNNICRKRKSNSEDENDKPNKKQPKIEIKEGIKDVVSPSNQWTSEQILSKLANFDDLKNILSNSGNANNDVLIKKETMTNKKQNSPPIVYDEYTTSVSPLNLNMNPTPVQQMPTMPFNMGLPMSNSYQHPKNVNYRKHPYVWSNAISGFPQMPQIGTDPRLLYKCPFPETNKPVTIDNETFHVNLDRIQPLVFHKGFFKAIRFSCSYIKVDIDGLLLELSTNQVNFVTIKGKSVALCIGGPFHEIIIDGWPYHVPMTGQTYTINMGPIPVNISFKVLKAFRLKTMHSIPKYIFNWVESEFFGHPKTLSIPPLNPLANPNLQDPISMAYRTENQTVINEIPQYNLPINGFQGFNGFPTNQIGPFNHMPVITPPMTTMTPPLIQPAIQTPPFNNCLLQNINCNPNSMSDINMICKNLISSGYQANSKHEKLDIDFTKYSYELFNKFNREAVEELHKDYQCDICGIRFADKTSSRFVNHMDYHYLKNSIYSKTSSKQRSYTKGSKSWIIDSNNRETTTVAESKIVNVKPEEKRFLILDEYPEHEQCMVCFDKFDVVWDRDEDNYILANAVLVDDKAYHQNCTVDIGKSFKVIDDDIKEALENIDPYLILQNLLKKDFQKDSNIVYSGV